MDVLSIVEIAFRENILSSHNEHRLAEVVRQKQYDLSREEEQAIDRLLTAIARGQIQRQSELDLDW